LALIALNLCIKRSFSARRARNSFAARNGKIEGAAKKEFEKQKSKKDTR